MRKQKART